MGQRELCHTQPDHPVKQKMFQASSSSDRGCPSISRGSLDHQQQNLTLVSYITKGTEWKDTGIKREAGRLQGPGQQGTEGWAPPYQSVATVRTQLQGPRPESFIPSFHFSVSCPGLISYSQGAGSWGVGGTAISPAHRKVQLWRIRQLTHIISSQLWPWAPALSVHNSSPEYCVPYSAETHQPDSLKAEPC